MGRKGDPGPQASQAWRKPSHHAGFYIRDLPTHGGLPWGSWGEVEEMRLSFMAPAYQLHLYWSSSCLLYTSDAADE